MTVREAVRALWEKHHRTSWCTGIGVGEGDTIHVYVKTRRAARLLRGMEEYEGFKVKVIVSGEMRLC
jgi:hypothetical protein